MIAIEAIVTTLSTVSVALIGGVITKFRKTDNDLLALTLKVEKKPDIEDVKHVIADKIEPLKVLLQEIKDDIKDIKHSQENRK